MEYLKLQQAGNLTPEQKIMIEKAHDQTKRDVAAMQARARVDAAEVRSKASGANVKAVPNSVMKELSTAEDISGSTMQAYTTFKPAYGGISGAIDSASGNWNPVASAASEEAANWWNMYEKGGLKERHDVFGATLSGNEAKSWNNATIQKGQPPAKILQNLKTRAEIAAKHYNSQVQKYATVGYPQVAEAFDSHPETAAVPEGAADLQLNPPTQQRVPTTPPQRRATDVKKRVKFGEM
jgi:hypothetical protein